MTCRECELSLGLDQYGAETAEHLESCASCRAIAEEIRANAEAFQSMAMETVPRIPPLRPDVGRPVLPAAIAAFALAAAAAIALFVVYPRQESLPPVRFAQLPMKFETPRPVPAPAPRPARAHHPLMIKMLTDDPNVVIYWQIDSEGDNR